MRRGDGTFGELIPGEQATSVPGYAVARGPIATVDNRVVRTLHPSFDKSRFLDIVPGRAVW
jgi:hypothetical protein